MILADLAGAEGHDGASHQTPRGVDDPHRAKRRGLCGERLQHADLGDGGGQAGEGLLVEVRAGLARVRRDGDVELAQCGGALVTLLHRRADALDEWGALIIAVSNAMQNEPRLHNFLAGFIRYGEEHIMFRAAGEPTPAPEAALPTV